MDKNSQMIPVKELYETPMAEISVVQESDIIAYSVDTPWDKQKTKRKYDF